eukprot:2581675-Prymnesium_polylepis.1
MTVTPVVCRTAAHERDAKGPTAPAPPWRLACPTVSSLPAPSHHACSPASAPRVCPVPTP